MTDIKSTLYRKTSLRKACKEFTLEELEKIFANLEEILLERKQEEEALEAKKAEKAQKMDAIRKEIEEAGIDLNELLQTMDTAPKQKAVVKPKYELTDENGEVHRWSGRGRTPKVFQKYFDKGRKKEEFLIGS